jgi:DNA-binding transcriptional regulator YdaS (Cro superfamily)
VTGLVRAVVSLTRTKRRRFLWCAWWTRAPAAEPFVPPDAWSGGARTEAEAIAAATARAGLSLEVIEGRWAGAWVRVRAGRPPFVERATRVEPAAPRPIDPHEVLGVPVGADLAALKAKFRERALVLHPDQGGDAVAFMALKRAYDTLAARRRRKPHRGA